MSLKNIKLTRLSCPFDELIAALATPTTTAAMQTIVNTFMMRFLKNKLKIWDHGNKQNHKQTTKPKKFKK